MNPNAEITLIDDDPALLDALSFQLDAAGYVVTAYTSAAEFLFGYQERIPDCIICDYQMPGFSGMDLLRRLAERGLNCPFIMLTAVGTIELAVEATKLGSFNFLQKGKPANVLIQAIEEARIKAADPIKVAARALIDQLTPKEKEVFFLITAGKSSKEIARELDKSTRTIEAHRANLTNKLETQSLVQLIKLRTNAGY